MPSIMSGFDTVQQALAAQQYALSITQKNVANATNPSYTRQVAVFTNQTAGGDESSIPVVRIEATRNQFIDYSISQELQTLAKSSISADALQEVESLFSGNGGLNLQQAISNFFGSFTQLSGTPEDLNLRQQVLSTANSLADTFRRLYAGIQRVQGAQNNSVRRTVDEINQLTSRIADLNERIKTAQGAQSDDLFTLRDTRQQVLEELSGLVDISYHETETGSVTVSTRQWGLLVLEDHVHSLSADTGADGLTRVLLDGDDITESLESGKLGGLIDVRDRKIGSYLDSLDELAAAIISRVNDQHSAGSDLDGLAGADIFVPFTQPEPGSNTGAARSMAVAITDARRVAAASDGGAAGNNDNAKLLAAITDEPLLGSETLSEFFAGLIYRVGSDGQQADASVLAQKNVIDGLKNLRDSLGGVNLDEEAINIMKYQKAYQASARYANTLELLSSDILQLLGT